MQNFDTRLFQTINNWANRSSFFDQIFVWGAKSAVVIFGLVLVYYIFKNRRIFWASVVTALVSRAILTELIRFIYKRPRPFIALDHVKLLIPKDGTEPSFPSGHAAFLFAVAFAVYLYDKKIGGILILVAFLMSFARIYTGVHYPSDIIGGILVAALSAFMTRRLRRKTF